MVAPFFLIDGYNLMHAAGLFRRRYGPGEFEKSRNRFLSHLANHLTEPERRRTTIVFDTPTTLHKASVDTAFHEMRIIYADSEDEADDVLEALIASHSAPKQIVLISSDHRLQKAVRRRRGKFLDSDDFFAQMEQRGEVSGPDASEHNIDPNLSRKRTGLQSQAETEAWMRVFGEIPETKPAPKSPPPASEERDIDREAWQREIDEME